MILGSKRIAAALGLCLCWFDLQRACNLPEVLRAYDLVQTAHRLVTLGWMM